MVILLLISNLFLQIILMGIIVFQYVRNKKNTVLIKNEIKQSVVPKFLDTSPEAKSLVELAIAFWRLEQKIKTSISLLISEDEQKAMFSNIDKVKRYLETHDIEVKDHTDSVYNDSINVDVISIITESNITHAKVKETVEPSVLLKGQLVRKAKVIIIEEAKS